MSKTVSYNLRKACTRGVILSRNFRQACTRGVIFSRNFRQTCTRGVILSRNFRQACTRGVIVSRNFRETCTRGVILSRNFRQACTRGVCVIPYPGRCHRAGLYRAFSPPSLPPVCIIHRHCLEINITFLDCFVPRRDGSTNLRFPAAVGVPTVPARNEAVQYSSQ
jgi:hypothetical protein